VVSKKTVRHHVQNNFHLLVVHETPESVRHYLPLMSLVTAKNIWNRPAAGRKDRRHQLFSRMVQEIAQTNVDKGFQCMSTQKLKSPTNPSTSTTQPDHIITSPKHNNVDQSRHQQALPAVLRINTSASRCSKAIQTSLPIQRYHGSTPRPQSDSRDPLGQANVHEKAMVGVYTVV
jgi:hypothetical protein